MKEEISEKDLIETLVKALYASQYELHPVYGSTSVCMGGIGGQMMTTHCALTCGNCSYKVQSTVESIEDALNLGRQYLEEME